MDNDIAQPTSGLPSISQADLDCAMAVRGAALLDNHLRNLLECALYGNAAARKELLDTSARLKTIAYCIGLINTTDYWDLRIIGNVRNLFAHQRMAEPPTFETEQIAQRVENLSTYVGARNGRAAYIKAVYRLAGLLNRKLAQVKRERNP